MNAQRNTQMPQENRHAYMIGGGIASLSAAAFLIRDAHWKGEQITILDESPINGGSLDGAGQADHGYVIRGGRMMNFTYFCTYDLFSSIPSLSNNERSVTEEIKQFNLQIKTHAQARLVQNGKILDAHSLGFNHRDRFEITMLMAKPESSLGTSRVDEHFSSHFFTTNFWYMWATMFAFEPWHSAVEFKRYLHRFMHEFERIDTLAGVDRTPYNQYDSMVLPLEKWLKEQGVVFQNSTKVIDIEFKKNSPQSSEQIVSAFIVSSTKANATERLHVHEEDFVFFTPGSMTDSSRLGSMNKPADLVRNQTDGSFALWKTIAKNRPELGRPENFCERVDESKWLSFTVTFKSPKFFQRIEAFSGNKPGTGALITLKDSNWLMSIVLAYQPHFLNQPANVQVCWGYGLFADREGNFIKKKMADCTGEEILIELLNHLRFHDILEETLRTSNCIPCMLPFITSQFLTRAQGDRPEVRPKGYKNLALLGQYVEIPKDVVFTVEYSVRSAQMAVYDLAKVDREVPKIYNGQHDPLMIKKAISTMLR